MAGETVGWTMETLVRPDGSVVELAWPFVPWTAFGLAASGRFADPKAAAEFINGAWTEEEPSVELIESFLEEVLNGDSSGLTEEEASLR